MEKEVMSVFSPESWIFASMTFIVGVLVKYYFNILSSPKIEIEKYIVIDEKKAPFIRARNKSKWIDAHELHFYIQYYVNNKRIHTKSIEEGVLRHKKDDTYSITPKDLNDKDIQFDFSKSNNRVDVILIYRNRFNKLSKCEKTLEYSFA